MASIQPIHLWSLIAGFVIVQIITVLIKNWVNKPNKETEDRRTGMKEIIEQMEKNKLLFSNEIKICSGDIKDLNINVVRGFSELKEDIAKKVDISEFIKLKDDVIRHMAREEGNGNQEIKR